MRITFLRRAESEFNADSASSVLDCSLTEIGRRQAASLRGQWPLVLVSPLLRAQLTIALSSIRYDRVEVWHLVREQRTDPCDFLEHEDLTEIESDEQLMDRADDFIHSVRSRFGGTYDDILVVSHCEFIHALTAESPHNATFVQLQLRPASAAAHEPVHLSPW